MQEVVVQDDRPGWDGAVIKMQRAIGSQTLLKSSGTQPEMPVLRLQAARDMLSAA